MLKGNTVDALTTQSTENISKLFHTPTVPVVYSLSKELIEVKTELIVLEKKINLAHDLLGKVEDQALIAKLKKQTEGFEGQKNNLMSRFKKIQYIIDSINDFACFYLFIKKFYTLAIQKKNFEDADKKISSKLITFLKSEKETLYTKYMDEDYFSKVLLALDFKRYQCYFKNYAKKFFENIQYTNNSYINSLLRLKFLFYECNYFITDNFYLSDLRLFLSRKIPITTPLPEFSYEMVALRCFFFYELLVEFLKLKPLTSNFYPLKKAISLDLTIVNYKADTKYTLIFSLNNLKEALEKVDKKRIDFFVRKSEDNKVTVNEILAFYKIIEEEFQMINKKAKILIDSKYRKLEKMRCLLAIFVNETHILNFLDIYNKKIGNDFSLNTIGNPAIIETNKEALNYLYQVLRKDKFYIPLNQKISSFINELIEAYSKDDITILNSITLDDLIEFSFYYLFTLLYPDFDTSLSEFNTKLLYIEMVKLNVFFNVKFQSLARLEKKIKAKVNKFLGKNFKDVVAYSQHKKIFLEKLN